MGASLAAGASASAAIAGAPAAAAAATALRKSALRTALETWLLDLVIESSCKRLKPSDEWKPAGSLPDDPLGTCLSCVYESVPLGTKHFRVCDMVAVVLQHRNNFGGNATPTTIMGRIKSRD
jgi:hypothetical protein